MPIKKMMLAAGFLLLAALLAVAEEPPKTLEIGMKAPEFRLQGVDGRWYSLKDFAAARILTVVFTS